MDHAHPGYHRIWGLGRPEHPGMVHFKDHMVVIIFFLHCPLALALRCACIKKNYEKNDVVREMELIHGGADCKTKITLITALITIC